MSSNLPQGTKLKQGSTNTFTVKVKNTGLAPEAFFVDPRLNQSTAIDLANQNGDVDPTAMTLPLPAGPQLPVLRGSQPHELAPRQRQQQRAGDVRHGVLPG